MSILLNFQHLCFRFLADIEWDWGLEGSSQDQWDRRDGALCGRVAEALSCVVVRATARQFLRFDFSRCACGARLPLLGRRLALGQRTRTCFAASLADWILPCTPPSGGLASHCGQPEAIGHTSSGVWLRQPALRFWRGGGPMIMVGARFGLQ